MKSATPSAERTNDLLHSEAAFRIRCVFRHRMGGASDNNVTVNKDGKKDAAYDRHGNLAEDGMTDGSYNRFSDADEPLILLTCRIAPWPLFGGTRKVPTETH